MRYEFMKKNDALSHALLTIQKQYPDEAALIQRELEAIDGSKDNLMVLSLAMMEIRSKAQNLKRSTNLHDELCADLERIEAIADRLHNVGSMMAKGQACNALSLYKNGQTRTGCRE